METQSLLKFPVKCKIHWGFYLFFYSFWGTRGQDFPFPVVQLYDPTTMEQQQQQQKKWERNEYKTGL